MAVVDYLKAVKMVKERRIEKEKAKALNDTTSMIGVYADNLVNKFKTEYFIQSSHGKRCCVVHCNPYPDAVIMQKVLKRITKKEYLAEFERILAEKLSKQGFSDFTLSESILNKKEPLSLKVKW